MNLLKTKWFIVFQADEKIVVQNTAGFWIISFQVMDVIQRGDDIHTDTQRCWTGSQLTQMTASVGNDSAWKEWC